MVIRKMNFKTFNDGKLGWDSNERKCKSRCNISRNWEILKRSNHKDYIAVAGAIDTLEKDNERPRVMIDLINPMSLQGFVNLRMVMIGAEYPKVYQYLQEEKQKHLEMLAIEGKIVFQRLRRNVARMVHMGKLLRRIYEELKELCLKADVDMLQVRTKEGR